MPTGQKLDPKKEKEQSLLKEYKQWKYTGENILKQATLNCL